MAMHFIFSDKAVLLFDFWSVHSPAGMALSVLVVLLLAVLYEAIKVGKAKLLHRTLESLPVSTSQQVILETDRDSASLDSPRVNRMHRRLDAGGSHPESQLLRRLISEDFLCDVSLGRQIQETCLQLTSKKLEVEP
ncbi:protein SLC31A2 isoform 3-T3 [Thomomys bottae]